MLRILHTGDWHLGHRLHDLPRDEEHAAFLAWLLDRVEAHGVDALLIAGDVFETANPPAAAMRAWYGFLARARTRFPDLDLVVIGGNHDSAARLEAAHPVLQSLRIQVVGRLPLSDDGALDLDALVVPLHGDGGAVAAWCAAVPFLRAADLPRDADPGIADGGDPLVAGVRAVYDRVLDHARGVRRPGQALVAMGHCYMVGGTLSELSERKVLGGNQHALPTDIFGADVAYVALGHLHRAQAVGGRESVRYAGSPLPLAVDEAPYPHQVRLLTLDGETLVGSESLPVPRHVDVLRVPGPDAAPWDQVEPLLDALPDLAPDGDDRRRPFLEVRVLLDGPMPSLRRLVEARVADKAVRLVKLAAVRRGAGGALADGPERRTLDDMTHEEVFRQKWRRDHDADPPDDVLACFHGLLDELGQHDDADPDAVHGGGVA
ncbi:MAG: exonuclease SbcCD subunit D C-terminal domain-containing protein [Alphaproteobacteria bacterium]|nr:exonuclease SbcCD subunit D C-terminal domain-containing protein [Alphaproteobacteria bacterium]